MAIWQFDLSLIPRDGMPWRTDDAHDVPPFEADQVDRAQAGLRFRFGEPWVMTEDWFVFGSETGNRVDIAVNEDSTAQIFARIDARTDASGFIDSLCLLCEELDCRLFSAEKWLFVEATPAMLALALDGSRAAAFVRDPIPVLRGIGSGG